jgi:hypothetical protein
MQLGAIAVRYTEPQALNCRIDPFQITALDYGLC